MFKEVVTATAIALTIGVAQAASGLDEACATDRIQLVAQAEDAKAGTASEPATAPAQAANDAKIEDATVNTILEDQQVAHDKYVVDRFLLAIAVVFAVIAAVLLFSLPPKRQQKE